MRIKSFKKILMIYLILALVSGCRNLKSEKVVDSGNLKIITTLFPQYDFVREIGKDKINVNLLIPPGVESHAYEPSPKDIVNIENADIFIYTGEYMEPWAVKIADTIKNESLVIVDASKDVIFLDEEDNDHDEDEGHEDEEHEDHEHGEDDHDHGGKDPHIWLDPIYAQKMVDNIVEGLVKADKANKDFYIKNGEEYKDRLQELDEKFLATFQKTKSNKIIYGGHFAFGYFAKRYNLEYISPYNGFFSRCRAHF